GSISWPLGDLAADLTNFIPDGETLTLTFTITVKDEHGATYTQTITVEIPGNTNTVEIWSEAADGSSPSPGDWFEGSNWKTGHAPTSDDDTFIITPADGSLFYPVTIKSNENGGAA